LEAWACAKPVVVTKCGGPGEFVRHEDDGWHVDPEAGSIAWGVSQVFNDWERSKHMGLRGRYDRDIFIFFLMFWLVL
jgi:glycosyltransferase involved in cell wall biosynthesis